MEEMEETIYDLCIIGAGFFGSVAARHASGFPNLKICLIGLDEPKESEMKNQSIFSSHYDEGRIMKVLFPSPTFQKLSRASINRLKHVENLSGIKFYNPVGCMRIGKKNTREMTKLEDVSAVVGTPVKKIFDMELMNALYPFLKIKNDEYALLDHTGAGVISARKMLEAERKIAQEQGCHILFDAVKDVQHLTDNYHKVETTNNGKLKAKRILFTTGAFTNVNKFSILPQLETYVLKEMVTMIRIPNSEAERLSSMTAIVHKRDHKDIGFYALPPVLYPDGRYYLKIGSLYYDLTKGMQTAEEIKQWYLSKDEKLGEKEALAKPLFDILPKVATEGLFRKVCVTTETSTGFPFIDQVTPTVTLAVAGNGWGATLAEEIGRLAACLSLSGTWDSEIPKDLFKIVVKEETT